MNDHDKHKPDPAPEPTPDPPADDDSHLVPDPDDKTTPYWEKEYEKAKEKIDKEYEDRYENPDWDKFGLAEGQSKIAILFFMSMVVLCNCIHTYIMMIPSEMWATYSSILVGQSMFHYGTATGAFLLLLRQPQYVTQLIFVRKGIFFLSCAYLSVYVLAFCYEIYLLFYSDDWMMMLVASYLGYSLMANVTIIPQLAYIVIEESENGLMNVWVESETGKLRATKKYWDKVYKRRTQLEAAKKDKIMIHMGGNKYVYC